MKRTKQQIKKALVAGVNCTQPAHGLVHSTSQSEELVHLTPEQIIMLQMSKEDIKNGDLITQDELDDLDIKWLRGK